ncbi:MAG: folate family ECF transporter S component [Clostridiales bacterium]|nr:folate family ECF transporter S component [Clostridiales bacterium]
MSRQNENGKLTVRREIAMFASVRVLSFAAMLAAISVVLSFIAKAVFPTGFIRVTFENLPVFLGSFFFGPCVGAFIAVAADLLSCLASGMAPNPIITLGAALIGAVSGVVYHYLPWRENGGNSLRTVLSVLAGHLIGSMAVKSAGLFILFGWAVLYRIPLYAAIAAAESFVLVYLMRNKAFSGQIVDKVMRRKQK